MSRRRFHPAAAVLPALIGVFRAFAAPADDAPPMPLWRVERTDGEPVRCGIEEYDAATGHWVFRMEFSGRPFAMDGAKIARLRPILRAAPPPAPHWVLETTDGDRIVGAQPRMDDRSVGLTHAHAGAISIERGRVAQLWREVEPAILYEGFAVGEVWESPNGAVRAGPDGLTINRPHSAARRIEGMGRRIRIEFTLPGFARFNLLFYSRANRLILNNAYHLVVNGPNAVELLRFRSNDAAVLNRQSIEPQMPSDGPIRFRLYADLDSGLILLTVNDRIAAEWKDWMPIEDVGDFLVFRPHDSSVQIEELRVSRWDGRHPLRDPTDRVAPTEDALELINGDVLEGKIVALRDGRAVFRSRLGEMAVPSERVARIRFPHPRVDPEAPAAVALFRLADGSQLHLELRGVKNGAVTGLWRGRLPFRFPLALLQEASWPDRIPFAPAPPAPPQRRAPRFSRRARESTLSLPALTGAARAGLRSRRERLSGRTAHPEGSPYPAGAVALVEVGRMEGRGAPSGLRCAEARPASRCWLRRGTHDSGEDMGVPLPVVIGVGLC